MEFSTIGPLARASAIGIASPQFDDEKTLLEPRTRIPATTVISFDESVTSDDRSLRPTITLPMPTPVIGVSADSTPIQIWEGTVVEVDGASGTMDVVLDAKIGKIDRHSATIDLQWVSDQDLDLVKPGSVFYLTLFKLTKRGSIQNAQELRFRRRPSWTEKQVRQVRAEAETLIAKMKLAPTAE